LAKVSDGVLLVSPRSIQHRIIAAAPQAAKTIKLDRQPNIASSPPPNTGPSIGPAAMAMVT